MMNSAELWAVVTLIVLEIILGLDNFVFVSQKLARFPSAYRRPMRVKLATVSLLTRWLTLWMLLRLIHCQFVFFTIDNFAVTLREVALVAGGLFLFIKSILQPLTVAALSPPTKTTDVDTTLKGSYTLVLTVTAFDSLCSVDSILAAVALSERLGLILVALVTAEFIMVKFHSRIKAIMRSSRACAYANLFVAFLGCVLVFRGLGLTVPNEVIYASMGVLVGMLVYDMLKRVMSSGVFGVTAAMAHGPAIAKGAPVYRRVQRAAAGTAFLSSEESVDNAAGESAVGCSRCSVAGYTFSVCDECRPASVVLQ